MNTKDIVRFGDILAIPFFLMLIFYFLNKEKLSRIELLLLLFSIGGFLFDTFFTIVYLREKLFK
jgi:uncharacterized membrane protein YbhN (UPF0104 family)